MMYLYITPKGKYDKVHTVNTYTHYIQESNAKDQEFTIFPRSGSTPRG